MELTVKELLWHLRNVDENATVYIHTPHNCRDLKILNIKTSTNELEIQVQNPDIN